MVKVPSIDRYVDEETLWLKSIAKILEISKELVDE